MNNVGNVILRNELKTILEKAVTKNSNFSTRAFAKKIGIDSGSLCRFLQGKRNLSQQLALKIIKKIDVTDEKKKTLERLFLDEDTSNVLFLKDNSIRLFWYYSAILSLLECDFPNKNIELIKTKFGLTQNEAEDAIEYLLAHGLIEKHNDCFLSTGKLVATSGKLSDPIVQNYLVEYTDLARAHLRNNDDCRTCAYDSLIFPCDPALYAEASKLLHKTTEDMRKLLSSSNNKDVYLLNIQFFPLTVNGK